MPEFSLQLFIFLTCVGLYTIAAAIWDIRIKKIPNKLTLPVFGLGLVYQGAFNQWAGLLDGLLGFAVGMPMGDIIKSFEAGVGGTLGHIALVRAFDSPERGYRAGAILAGGFGVGGAGALAHLELQLSGRPRPLRLGLVSHIHVGAVTGYPGWKAVSPEGDG